MAGRARGRGHFRPSDTTKTPGVDNSSNSREGSEEPKPGGGAGGIDINMLSLMVQSLALDADDISKNMVSDAVIRYATNESHVEEILRILYIRILQDWRHARHMAFICTRLVKIPELGTTFRTSLVRRIQSDFNTRETDRVEKPRTFLACMAFLCQVLQQLRNADGQPFRPLVTPVYIGLEMLLDDTASERELEVAVTQLLDVGPLLHELNDAPMGKLMKILRVKVLEATASRETRSKMLNILETRAAGWKPLPEENGTEEKDASPKQQPTAQGDAVTKETSATQSPKHASPKRVSFSNITEVSTVSTNTYDSQPTYTSAKTTETDGWGSDFGGVWENPPADGNESDTYTYTWTSGKNDNDAGQWEDVVAAQKK